jgi:hypothetical protein
MDHFSGVNYLQFDLAKLADLEQSIFIPREPANMPR